MPKFNKPKVNQPKVNKSQVDDRPNQSKSLPSESELPLVQLDETIVAGRRPKPLNDLQRLLAELPELGGTFKPEIFADLDENNPFNGGQFESKIRRILGNKKINADLKNTIKYLDYLKQNFQVPCHVTGIEEFEWEEEYLMGFGTKKEYARLKKTQPSYTDKFTIHRLEDFSIQEDGIFVEVQRVGDRKKFMLRLAELESVDDIPPNNHLLHDYAVWWINY
ncbi:MAG: hypothetical protein JGK24_13775 [Microcoleus sp. PH2017_29_MFU_D_A]|uniref:hypothetical protein n=1 Tax=unclassified Microcoleus TaxID=2642155 RepID=UPI001D6ED5E2|nr:MULTISPECIES: hypothetical protein [unclassified Microcoleus]MCC3421231.1 hypothetical protein [Microcoleus sp. PH2017_07_MST_O_A]MCC3432182.1 hypothetical protein [Microcoleus sp. PH2017_04_SCI_O_A]MCC3444652.1 hypothetical protein [Microcoleus sp. PH2017_03_ELD_O_A]MCC3469042.1 hypothetical protein [Microcoleus sp. PH2017_06_SFM_O_A]MCC3505189.1 hypothetical protein [Microcoleus sp. PH2017_19_SFW_U_A]MCC3510179.1 hypothetical protein [Microcoleus sp. PH2017_17_BER_D_A]TAE11007.1 MAG: hy